MMQALHHNILIIATCVLVNCFLPDYITVVLRHIHCPLHDAVATYHSSIAFSLSHSSIATHPLPPTHPLPHTLTVHEHSLAHFAPQRQLTFGERGRLQHITVALRHIQCPTPYTTPIHWQWMLLLLQLWSVWNSRLALSLNTWPALSFQWLI